MSDNPAAMLGLVDCKTHSERALCLLTMPIGVMLHNVNVVRRECTVVGFGAGVEYVQAIQAAFCAKRNQTGMIDDALWAVVRDRNARMIGYLNAKSDEDIVRMQAREDVLRLTRCLDADLTQ